MTKEILLTKGRVAIVDAQNYEWLMQWKWCYYHKGYAVRANPTGLKNPRQKTIQMHRLITDATEDKHVDHINGNGLDNRRSNLRICSIKDNVRNQKKMLNTTSKYKGVCWKKNKNKWMAYIGFPQKYIGMFHDEKEAAFAYNAAAVELFGDFARLNTI